jgi:hypothetical protein
VQRRRAAFRLTSWLFVAALLLKSAVPLLASAAAGLQGRATAEVCDVYGVDMSRLATRSLATEPHYAEHVGHARHAQGHDAHRAHHAAGERSTAASEHAPAHGPASRVAHGGDHCALSALTLAFASATLPFAAPLATDVSIGADARTTAPAVDSVARWAARLRHAPPVS